MNIHKNPNLLVQQLQKTEGVHGVSYEYPGFWSIDTVNGCFYLGDSNGFISWNAEDGNPFLDGETTAKTPATIARDFGAWLRGEL
jgi:hypothetical protein